MDTEPQNIPSISEIRTVIKEELSKDKKSKFDRIVGLLDVTSKFIWPVVIFITVCIFYRQITNEIIPNITSFKFAGVEATLNKDFSKLSQAARADSLNYISPLQKDLIIQRSQTLILKLKKSRILWVDPNYNNNKYLRDILEKWGLVIDSVATNTEAFTHLQNSIDDGHFITLL